MSPVILHLRAWRWEQGVGAGRMGSRLLQHLWRPVNHSPPGEPVLLPKPESWAEPRVAARAPGRQMGNGCVSALTFCRQMSKCVCASLVLPQQLLH